MTGISWMLQEAAQCPPEDYQDQDLVYDHHLGEEELASGEFDSLEYEEYSYDVHSEKVGKKLFLNKLNAISVQYPNIFNMLSKVLWPSDRPEGEEDYDFVYRLNISEEGRTEARQSVHSLSLSLFRLPLHSDVATRRAAAGHRAGPPRARVSGGRQSEGLQGGMHEETSNM